MRRSTSNLSFFAVVVVGLILALATPMTAFGQGRGRGHGYGRGSNYDKKCLKFRNCHDASEGRWDNRGPRGKRVGILNGGIFNTGRRSRRIDRDGDGDFDRNDILLGRRSRRVDRDGDGDFDRNDILLGRRRARSHRGY
jgi:hypothetical protein